MLDFLTGLGVAAAKGAATSAVQALAGLTTGQIVEKKVNELTKDLDERIRLVENGYYRFDVREVGNLSKRTMRIPNAWDAFIGLRQATGHSLIVSQPILAPDAFSGDFWEHYQEFLFDIRRINSVRAVYLDQNTHAVPIIFHDGTNWLVGKCMTGYLRDNLKCDYSPILSKRLGFTENPRRTYSSTTFSKESRRGEKRSGFLSSFRSKLDELSQMHEDLQWLAQQASAIDSANRMLDTWIDQTRKDFRASISSGLRIAVFGGFSTGKSTFINALLGRQFLPSSTNPTTTVTCEVAWGEVTKATAYYRSENEVKGQILENFEQLKLDIPHPIDFEDSHWRSRACRILSEVRGSDAKQSRNLASSIESFQSKRAYFGHPRVLPNGEIDDVVSAPTSALFLSSVRIETPTSLLRDNVQIVDAPGGDSLDKRHAQIARAIAADAHCVLFFFDGLRPFTKSDLDRLMEIMDSTGTGVEGKKIFFLVNKIDVMTERQIAEASDHIKSELETIFGIKDAKLYLISSRLALLARMDLDGSLTPLHEGVENYNEFKREKRGARGVLSACGYTEFEKSLSVFLGSNRGQIILAAATRRLEARATNLVYGLSCALDSVKQSTEETATRLQKLTDATNKLRAVKPKLCDEVDRHFEHRKIMLHDEVSGKVEAFRKVILAIGNERRSLDGIRKEISVRFGEGLSVFLEDVTTSLNQAIMETALTFQLKVSKILGRYYEALATILERRRSVTESSSFVSLLQADDLRHIQIVASNSIASRLKGRLIIRILGIGRKKLIQEEASNLSLEMHQYLWELINERIRQSRDQTREYIKRELSEEISLWRDCKISLESGRSETVQWDRIREIGGRAVELRVRIREFSV